MERIKQRMKSKYNLSNYQIAQFFYFMKTLASESSKILIMGILFHSKWRFYLFALLIMICVRCAMGGLHFYTYPGCLTASVLYLWLAVYILPHLLVPVYVQLPALAGCLITCHLIGPITSRYRPEECKKHFPMYKRLVMMFLFAYAIVLFLFPDNPYLFVGFWVILLHSLQLIAAKILKKGASD